MKSNLSPLTTANQAVRQTQVENQLMEVGARVDLLEKGIATLAERLQPVSFQQPVERDDTNKSVPEPCICPFAERLRNVAKNLDGLIQQLQALNDNLEL